MDSGTAISPARGAFWVVLFATLCRLALGGCTGLGIDESYMVAASDRFAASYFDHPLASWWLELASRWLFGTQTPIVVRLPFILLAALSSYLLFALTRRLFGPAAAFWAVVAFSVSPVFSLAFGSWVLPDGPLDAALLFTCYGMARALGLAAAPASPQPAWWLAAGLGAGLTMLSKYNGALCLAGAALAVLTDPLSRRELRRPWPWLAAVMALLIFTPVIGWNAAHGWQSFHYQGGRATGLRLRPLAPFAVLGGEALFVLPWLWVPLVVLWVEGLRRGDRRAWLLAMMAAAPLVFFPLISLWSSAHILYHWAAPGYLLLLPLLGQWAAALKGRARRWLRRIAAASGALLALAAALMIAVLGHGIAGLDQFFPPGKSPLLQAEDWDSLRPQIAARQQLDPHLAVAALRWYDAGKIGYALRGQIPVTVFGPEPHQFGIASPPARLLGRDILIIAMPGDISAIAAKYRPYFQTISPGPALTVRAGGALLVIPTLLGQNLLTAP